MQWLLKTIDNVFFSERSSLLDQGEEGFLVIETNYRVYAYTGKLLIIVIYNTSVSNIVPYDSLTMQAKQGSTKCAVFP